jgi:hypothetical protein
MTRSKTVAVIGLIFAVSSLNAATVPAGTTLTVTMVTPITSKDVAGRSFEAKIAEDVSIKGNVLLKAGTKAFGKIKSSRYDPRRNEPLNVELTSLLVNRRNVAVKTNSVEPSSPIRTARQARYGHSAGKLTVTPGTRMQFQLLQPVTL